MSVIMANAIGTGIFCCLWQGAALPWGSPHGSDSSDARHTFPPDVGRQGSSSRCAATTQVFCGAC